MSPLWHHMMFAGCKGLQAAAWWDFHSIVGPPVAGWLAGRLSALSGEAKYFGGGGRRRKKEEMEGRREREELLKSWEAAHV